MIRLYQDSDFADCVYLNKVSYLEPCTENELWAKTVLPSKVWVYQPDPAIRSVVGCLILEGNLVWSVTVAPAFRRQGIATKLLLEAEKHVLPLYLHTEPDSPGNHLYTKLGYIASKIEYDYYGQNLDAVLMVKR